MLVLEYYQHPNIFKNMNKIIIKDIEREKFKKKDTEIMIKRTYFYLSYLNPDDFC